MVQSAQDRTTVDAPRVFGGARYRRVLCSMTGECACRCACAERYVNIAPSRFFELFDELGLAIEDRDQLDGRTTRFDQASLVLVERIRTDPEQGAGPALRQTELGPHLANRLGRRDAVHPL